MLKKKGAPSFKPKAAIRRNAAPAAAKSQSGTPAPTQPSVSNDSANVPTPVATAAHAPAPDITLANPPTLNIETSGTQVQTADSVGTFQPAVTPVAVEKSSIQAISHATQSQDENTRETIPRQAIASELPSVQIPTVQSTLSNVTAHEDVPTAQSATLEPTLASLPTPLSKSATWNWSEFPSSTEHSSVMPDRDEASRPQISQSTVPYSTIGTSVIDHLIVVDATRISADNESITATRKRGAPAAPSSEDVSGGTPSGDPAAPSPKRRRTANNKTQDATVKMTEPNGPSQPVPQKRGGGRSTYRALSGGQSQETTNDNGQPDDNIVTSQRKRKPRVRKTATAANGATDGASSAQPKKQAKKSQTPRASTNNGESVDDADGTSEARIRRRASRKPRKERSVTPEDAEQRAIDTSSLTMAELTKDLRIGKKFSRHDELRDRMKTLQEKQREERRLRKANGLATPGAEEATVSATGGAPGSTETTSAPAVTNLGGGSSTQPVALGPQFEIINGEIVINQASLVHDRHAAAMVDQADMEEVEENDFTRMTNQATYLRPTKIKGPNSWTKEETQQFYEYLRMFGTDFQTIANMFPGRMRRHVKMKFNREERHNPTGVNAALVGQKVVMIDLAEYQTRTGKALEPTADIEEEHRKRAEAHEAEQKRIQEEADAVQAEKRKKLLGAGPESGNVKLAEKATMKDASDDKIKGAPKSQTQIMEEDEDVEVIDEDEVEARPTRRRRMVGGIGG